MKNIKILGFNLTKPPKMPKATKIKKPKSIKNSYNKVTQKLISRVSKQNRAKKIGDTFKKKKKIIKNAINIKI